MNRESKFDYLLKDEQEAYDKVLKLIDSNVMPWAKVEVIKALDELVELLTKESDVFD